jgi:hypothetical protein
VPRTLRSEGTSTDIDGLNLESHAKVDEEAGEGAIAELGEGLERGKDAAQAG